MWRRRSRKPQGQRSSRSKLKTAARPSIFSFLFGRKKVQEKKAPTIHSQAAEHLYKRKNRSGLNTAAMKLILDFEVGGGERYYNSKLKAPCWPGASSGVTVGIGYDLGYKSASQIRNDWSKHLPSWKVNKLVEVSGVKGRKALDLLWRTRGIEIDWDAALEVYKEKTIPRFIATTLRAFPGADLLHPSAFGALVSLVFNRGGSVNGSRRSEMLAIRGLVPKKDYSGMARKIREMKRLWSKSKLRGLHRRRDAEANLIDSAAGL